MVYIYFISKVLCVLINVSSEVGLCKYRTIFTYSHRQVDGIYRQLKKTGDAKPSEHR